MEECKDIMVIDWATGFRPMPKRSICHICSVWEGDVDIGSTEWILSCMLAICRLSASGK